MEWLNLVIKYIYYGLSATIPMFLFAINGKRRENFKIRLISCFLVLFVYSILIPTIMYFNSSNEFLNSITFGWIYFLLLYILTVLSVYISYDTTIWGGIFCATCGYCIQHLWGRVIEMPIYLFVHNHFTDTHGLYRLITFSLLILLCFIVYRFVIKKLVPKNGRYTHNELLVVLGSTIVVGITIVYCPYPLNDLIKINAIIGSDYKKYIDSIQYYMFIISAIVAVLCLLLNLSIYRNRVIQDEMKELDDMLLEQKTMYLEDKKNAELLNIKAHDLKHKLNSIQGLSQEEIDETLAIIQGHDSMFDVNNTAINVIINKKVAICNQNNIQFRCNLNGKLLKHVHSYELYSLFGNALDNAIESVKNLEVDKRIISINQLLQGNILQVNIENYYNHVIKFENNIPVTTKAQEPGYHGFGVKSIKLLMEKLGGNVQIDTMDNIFTLSLFFIVPDDILLKAKDDPILKEKTK